MTRAWLLALVVVAGIVGLLLALSNWGGFSPSHPRDTIASEMFERYEGELPGLPELLRAAEEARSDAVVILKDGKLVGEWYFNGKPRLLETMSVTKSIVSLAIGRLLTLGLLESIDVPVYTFYPEWKQGRKQEITIRHILSHTSGLQNVPDARVEIYPSPDFVQLALAAELKSPPGTRFEYNNKAVNLLAGVVERASGKKLDEFMRDEVFAPLGIREFSWQRDRAGNPHAMAGLALFPIDLAKLGQLVLNKGVWQGERLIDEGWFEESFRPLDVMPEHGLLWWLLRDPEGSVFGYWAQGYLGQYLVIYPDKKLVGVRMIAPFEGYDEEKHLFRDLPRLLYEVDGEPFSTARKPKPSPSRANRGTEAAAAQRGGLWVEQGVLARVRRGKIIEKETFTLWQQGEGFVLLAVSEFEEPSGAGGGRKGRQVVSWALGPGYRPQAYTFLRTVEREDPGEPEILSAQVVFAGSEGRAQAEVRRTHPTPSVERRAWELPDLPVVVLQPGVLSSELVLLKLFVSLGQDELTAVYLNPLHDAMERVRLRRLLPAAIVRNDTGEEMTAERLELALEADGRVYDYELFLKDGEFLGLVSVGFGDTQALIFRWDLFPKGFRIQR